MAVLYSNNASTTLSASITNSATSLTVAAGKGALFPAISGSDYFYITLVAASGVIEIMKVTARSADVFTVTRGQDGTTAVAWAAGDRVELRFNKALLDDVKSALVSAVTSADWNVANPNVAQLISTSTNGVNGVTNYVGMHFPHASLNYGFQIAGRNDSAYYRTLENNTYTAWRAIAHSATQLYTFPVLDNNLNLDSGQQDKVWATNIGTATDRGTKPTNYAFVVNLGGRAASGLQIAASYGGSDNFYVRRGSDNGGSVNGANAWQPWYTLLHSGNYSSYAAAASHTHSYLPLSGGTVNGMVKVVSTGGFNGDTGDGSVNFLARLNSDSTFLGAINQYGYQAFAVNILGSQDSASSRGYVSFYTKTDGSWKEALRLNDGTVNAVNTLTQGGNQVLHAGNFSSYALPNPGSGTGGRVLVNLSGNPSWSDASFTYDPIMGQFRATNFRANVGDAAPTWNFNAILHAGNYTSYSPSLTGSGASGTWGINVSGSAATASNTSNAWQLGTDIGSKDSALQYWQAHSNTTLNPNSDWHYALRMSHGDAETYYSATIALAFGDDVLSFRRKVNGTNQTWRTVLHSGNYTNYGDGRYVLKTGDTMTGTLQVNSLSNSVIAQHDGTGAYWRGRIISRNSDANRAVFLGNYNSKAGLFAHTNALDGWAPLYLNTLGDNGGSTVYLPHNATYTLDSGNNAYAILNAGNYTGFSGYLRAGGGNDGMDFNTLSYNTMYYAYISDSPNRPVSYSYPYGTVLTFDPGQGTGGRAQFYISHAGNDLIFRGGWGGNGSWQTWNRVLTDQNYTSYTGQYVLKSGDVMTGNLLFQNTAHPRVFNDGSSSLTSGYYLANANNSRAWNWQLDENNNAAIWSFNGSGWAKRATVTQDGYMLAGGKYQADGWVHPDRDFVDGTLIQTDIAYNVTNGDPFVLEIRGNSYGSQVPFDIQYQGYIYSDTIINHGGYSNGTNITGLVAINYNGNLCFWFPRQSYWHGFYVRAYSAYATYPRQRVSSISNSAKPTTAKQVDLSSNIRQSLHSGNYTSYSPSLTGSGASGTWTINVTGSAASVGNYSADNWLRKVGDASQFQIYGNSRSIIFRTDGTTNPHGGGAYPYIWFYGGSADTDRRMIMNTSGQLWLSNYGWLHDAFAGASHTHNYMSADYSRPGGDLNTKLIPGNYGISYTESNRPADWGALIVGRSSDVVAQWYLDHNNAFWIRGGNPPAAGGGGVWNSWREVLHSGNYTNYAAPVSHTHNYVLKTGDTMTGRLTIDGSGWTTNNRNYSNEWIEFGNYSGLYSPNNGAHFYPNNATYGSWRVAGSRNGWSGLSFDANSQMTLMIATDANTSGVHNDAYGWQWRWNSGTMYVYKNAYGGGTAATVLDSSNYSNYSLPLGGGTINGNLTVTGTLTAAGRNLAYSTTINMSSLDANTWYPVTIPLPANRRTTMRIENALNSNVPSWSTHGSGFSLYFEWISNGSGWGTIGVERTIVNWRQQFSNVTIVGGVTQMGYSSTEVIWLRGGGTYYFSADNIVSPAIQTSTYTVYGQSVSPSTSIQNDVWSQAGGRIGAYEFQAVGNMFAGGGNTVLHAGNYTSYVVGLSGGTLTGNLSISGSSTQILFTGNTASTLIQSFSGIDTKFSIYNSGTSIGISNALGTLNLVSSSGVLANGNTILHAGNYTSYGDGRYLRGDGTTPVTANNLNFGIGRYFGYTYIQTFSGENLHLNPSTSNGGDVYIRGNLALHAGNISSYVTSAPTAFNVVGSIAYLYRTNGGNNSALAAGVSVSGSTLFYCSTARTDSGYTGFVTNVTYNGSGIGRTTAFTASNGAGTFSPIGGTWRSLSYVSPAVYDAYGGTTYAGGLYVRVA